MNFYNLCCLWVGILITVCRICGGSYLLIEISEENKYQNHDGMYDRMISVPFGGSNREQYPGILYPNFHI